MKNDNAGYLTFDFIFAIMMAAGFSIILFSFAFTLSMVEVAQYITFSSARSYWAGHFTINDQIGMGTKKFAEITNNPAIKPLFRPGGWFELQVDGAPVGDYGKIFASKGVTTNPDGTTVFMGSRIRFVSNIMNIRFPIIGSTGGSGGGFGANIGSYLSREPSEQECRGFEDQRFSNILKLNPAYSSNGLSADGFVSVVDNGC